MAGTTTFVKDELYQHIKSKKLYWYVKVDPPVLKSTRAVGTKVVRNPDPKKYKLFPRGEL